MHIGWVYPNYIDTNEKTLHFPTESSPNGDNAKVKDHEICETSLTHECD